MFKCASISAYQSSITCMAVPCPGPPWPGLPFPSGLSSLLSGLPKDLTCFSRLSTPGVQNPMLSSVSDGGGGDWTYEFSLMPIDLTERSGVDAHEDCAHGGNACPLSPGLGTDSAVVSEASSASAKCSLTRCSRAPGARALLLQLLWLLAVILDAAVGLGAEEVASEPPDPGCENSGLWGANGFMQDPLLARQDTLVQWPLRTLQEGTMWDMRIGSKESPIAPRTRPLSVAWCMSIERSVAVESGPPPCDAVQLPDGLSAS
jgi:hypothetical protein